MNRLVVRWIEEYLLRVGHDIWPRPNRAVSCPCRYCVEVRSVFPAREAYDQWRSA